jgi:hypothetical protein
MSEMQTWTYKDLGNGILCTTQCSCGESHGGTGSDKHAARQNAKASLCSCPCKSSNIVAESGLVPAQS